MSQNLPPLPDPNWLLEQVKYPLHYALGDRKNLLKCDVPNHCNSILGNLDGIEIDYQQFVYLGDLLQVPIVNAKVVKLDRANTIDHATGKLYKEALQQSVNGFLSHYNYQPSYSQTLNRYFPWVFVYECLDGGDYIGVRSVVVNQEYIANFLIAPKTQVLPVKPQQHITNKSDNKGIDIILDGRYAEIGKQYPVKWDFKRDAHAFIFGPTGSWKSGQLLVMLSQTAKIRSSKLFVCDFKNGDDFQFLEGCEDFYTLEDCKQGLDNFYQVFEARRRKKDLSRSFVLLAFDEWASYLDSIDKREAEDEKRKMANILRQGRAFNVHVAISQQRGDSVYFQTARDNFNLVIGLGRLSTESIGMFFGNFKDEIKKHNPNGTGYMLDSNGFRSVRVLPVNDFTEIKVLIHNAVKGS